VKFIVLGFIFDGINNKIKEINDKRPPETLTFDWQH